MLYQTIGILLAIAFVICLPLSLALAWLTSQPPPDWKAIREWLKDEFISTLISYFTPIIWTYKMLRRIFRVLKK